MVSKKRIGAAMLAGFLALTLSACEKKNYTEEDKIRIESSDEYLNYEFGIGEHIISVPFRDNPSREVMQLDYHPGYKITGIASVSDKYSFDGACLLYVNNYPVMCHGTGLDQDGKIIKGHADGYSKVEIHSYLLSEGYEVYSIRTNRWIQILYGGTGTNKVKIKTKDLIFFVTQLSTYLKSGITLVESLKILSRQYKKKKYIKIFKMIIYDLSMGENLSTAMENRGVAFPNLLITMVKSSEMTGELPEVLDDMADY